MLIGFMVYLLGFWVWRGCGYFIIQGFLFGMVQNEDFFSERFFFVLIFTFFIWVVFGFVNCKRLSGNIFRCFFFLQVGGVYFRVVQKLEGGCFFFRGRGWVEVKVDRVVRIFVLFSGLWINIIGYFFRGYGLLADFLDRDFIYRGV